MCEALLAGIGNRECENLNEYDKGEEGEDKEDKKRVEIKEKTPSLMRRDNRKKKRFSISFGVGMQ